MLGASTRGLPESGGNEVAGMKNIILLITDTYRYDNLSGRSRLGIATPALDRFAAERATSIERFYAGSFPTIPHRTDLARGVLGWPHYGWQPLDQSGPNHIARILADQGYATQLICDCPHLFNARFQHGFHAAFQNRGQEGDLFLLHLNDPIAEVMPREKTRQPGMFRNHTLGDLARWSNRYPRYEDQSFAARTSGTVVRWLEENYQAGPFFLWADFFDPHEPWDPPEYLVRRHDPDYDGVPMIHPNYGPAVDYTPAELRNLQAHYAAEAELVDRMLGRVLQKIDDLQLWNDTIVVVTSDHGFSVGDHGRTGKSNIHPTDPTYWPIYPEIGHVPFLVAGAAIPAGRSLGLIAQPIDILPTLCDLAGVKAAAPVPFEGRSLAGAVLRSSGSHREVAVSGSFIRPENGRVPPKSVTPFVVTARWGYTPMGPQGRAELYDLDQDPFADHDLIDTHPGPAADLHALLLEHLKQHRAPAEQLALWQVRPGS